MKDATSLDRYAVLGNPVAHSRSPFIHTLFATQTGQAVRYERVFCELNAFAATVQSFAAKGGRGCNVTLPFKFEAPALAAHCTMAGINPPDFCQSMPSICKLVNIALGLQPPVEIV